MVEHPLQTAMLNAPTLANLAGLSVYTVREMIGGRRTGTTETRAKLAAALRQHSETLTTLAEQIEHG